MVHWRIQNQSIREFLAEFLGTMVLVGIGCSGNVATTLSGSAASGVMVPMIWGLSLTVAIYVCGGVSGGHVNPAVTVSMATVGKFKWSKVLHYIVAQYLGGFVGAVLAFIVYREGIDKTKGFNSSTMGAFGTYSNEHITTGTALLDQIVCTAFFLLIICAITDEKNMQCPKGLVPIAIGFANIGVLHFSFGWNCGTPLNPARDFSPRILTTIAGWGGETFSHAHFGYFWVPIVACHIGGILGCWTYRLFIENHWPKENSFEFNNNEPAYGKTVRVASN